MQELTGDHIPSLLAAGPRQRVVGGISIDVGPVRLQDTGLDELGHGCTDTVRSGSASAEIFHEARLRQGRL